MYNSFISLEKDNEQSQNVTKTCYWKLIFVIRSYSTWARRHAKHASHVGTWARRHASTWAHMHARHVGNWVRKHARHVGTWARKHARHVGTWVSKARNLADSRERHSRNIQQIYKKTPMPKCDHIST